MNRHPGSMADTEPSFKLIQLMTGFWLSRAIYVATKLGIADLLKEEPKNIAELAKSSESHEPSLYRVMRALVSVGIFAEDERGRFALTPLAATLRSDVPGSLRAWVNMQSGDEQYRAWGDLLHSVKTGETAFNHVFGMSVWEYRAQNPEQAKTFDDAMANQTGMYNTAVMSSYTFSGFEKIVDVGGGDGSLLTTILKANAGLKGVVFDLRMSRKRPNSGSIEPALRNVAKLLPVTFLPRCRTAEMHIFCRGCFKAETIRVRSRFSKTAVAQWSPTAGF